MYISNISSFTYMYMYVYVLDMLFHTNKSSIENYLFSNGLIYIYMFIYYYVIRYFLCNKTLLIDIVVIIFI